MAALDRQVQVWAFDQLMLSPGLRARLRARQ